MSFLRRPITLPWPLLAILVVLTAGSWIQGLRMARDRQQRLQPARAESIDLPSAAGVAISSRFAVIELGAAAERRLGLYQWLPSRALIRWIEPLPRANSDRLVIPLEGLAPGEYALCAVDDAETGGPREMDLPPRELEVIGRFEVER